MDFAENKGDFTFLATGGNQATNCYPTLKDIFGSKVSHAKIVLGDERLVPMTSSWSNTAMLFNLFGQASGALQISSPVLPFEAELKHVEEIMANEEIDLNQKRAEILEKYSALLRQVVANYDRIISKSPKPTFVHLGLGPDGHIASLFPTRDDLDISGKFSQISLDLDQNNKMLRATVSLETLNAAEMVVVSASGPDKGKLIARALDRDMTLPVSHLSPSELVFLVDASAADAIYGR